MPEKNATNDGILTSLYRGTVHIPRFGPGARKSVLRGDSASGDKGEALLTFPESPPALAEARRWRAVTAIAPGQARGETATAKQHALLTACGQVEAFSAIGGAIGQLQRAAATAEPAAVAGLEQTDFREYRVRHGGLGNEKGGRRLPSPAFRCRCPSGPKTPSPALRAPRSAPRPDRFAIRRSSAQEAVLPKACLFTPKGEGHQNGLRPAFNQPRRGRCGTCASSRHLPATHPGARSSARHGTHAPGAAS